MCYVIHIPFGIGQPYDSTREAEERKEFDFSRGPWTRAILFILIFHPSKNYFQRNHEKANYGSEAEPPSGGQICSGSLFHSDTNFSNNVITRRTEKFPSANFSTSSQISIADHEAPLSRSVHARRNSK